jgi:ArsR family transcriptional regulator
MMESVDLTIGRPISEAKADLFRALAHPARIRALEVLSEGELSVGAVPSMVGIESSYLSQQLGILRRSGLVTARKDGSQVFYSVADSQLIELLGVAKRVLIRSLSNTEDLLANLRAELAEAE